MAAGLNETNRTEGDYMAVPEAMKGKYEAIAKWIEPFCDSHLNDE